MNKLKWYFKNGTKYETYSVLYEDEKFILVKNDETEKFSFGMKEDFGTLCGFPVNQSCLTLDEATRQLEAFIEIEKKYVDSLGEIAIENINRWDMMIEALKSEV